MALTRKLLKGMGLTDEQVDTIIEAHTDTVDGLKADVAKYRPDAERLQGVQKELDDLRAAGDGGYKDRYEKEHSAFESYKADITAKESRAAREKAVRAYFEDKRVTGANLEIAMRGVGQAEPGRTCYRRIEHETSRHRLERLISSVFRGFPENFCRHCLHRCRSAEQIRGMSAAEINANWDGIKASLNQKGA